MIKNIFLGGDPGKSGCMALVHRSGGIVDLIRFNTTYAEIGASLLPYRKKISFALIESVHSMPKQGVASSFKFGDAFGAMKMAIAICRIRHEFITPSKWQRVLNCRTKGNKNITKDTARRLFPGADIFHWNADALLLAELARRMGMERGW